MPGDLTIRPLSPLPPAQPAPSKAPVVPTPPVGAALAAVVPQVPSIALNAEKGVVVIDFRNEAGTIVNSIPTARQLAAYAASQPPTPVTPAPASGEATTSLPGASEPAPPASLPKPRR